MTRNKIVLSGVAALALAIGGAAAVYFLFIKSDAPPPVSLEEALRTVATSTPASGSSPASSGTATPVSTTPAASGTTSGGGASGLAGVWTISTSGQSFVGYRVQEELVGVGANTAVGRTSAIQASMTFDGTSVTKLEVTADLRQLRSDNSLRDGQLRSQAIETNRFPNATFVLTSPIQIGPPPGEGQTVTKTVTGDLTLHGVTKRITMEVQGQMTGGQVVVVGSTQIVFADYSIGQPRGASVVSIEDRGVMELQLVFAKAAG